MHASAEKWRRGRISKNQSFENRVISKVNWKIAHCGNLPNKNQHHGLYTGYIKDAPAYPFKYSSEAATSAAQGYNINLAIKTGRKYYNLPGIQAIQTFLQGRIGHKPSIDELAEFISLYTIRHERDAKAEQDRIYRENLEKAKLAAQTAARIAQMVSHMLDSVVESAEAAENQALKLQQERDDLVSSCQADGDDDWESLMD